MEPILEVVPIPAMVPAPIMVPAPAWNRLQLWLFESNGDSDSGIVNVRNDESSNLDRPSLRTAGKKPCTKTSSRLQMVHFEIS